MYNTHIFLGKCKPWSKLLDLNSVILCGSRPGAHDDPFRFVHLSLREEVKAFFLLTTLCTMILAVADLTLSTTDWAEETHFTSNAF